MIKGIISNKKTESQEKNSILNSLSAEIRHLNKFLTNLVTLISSGLPDDRPTEYERDQEFEDWLDSLEEKPEKKE